MADTITLTAAIASNNTTNGTFSSSGSQGTTLTQAGYLVSDWSQTIGTTEEKIEVPSGFGTTADVWVLVKNMDEDNFIELGLTGSTGVYQIKVPPLGSALFAAHNLPNASSKMYMFAKADTAVVKVQVWIVEM